MSERKIIIEYKDADDLLKIDRDNELFEYFCKSKRYNLLFSFIKKYNYFDTSNTKKDDIITSIKKNYSQLTMFLLYHSNYEDFTYNELLEITEHTIKNNDIMITDLLIERNKNNRLLNNVAYFPIQSSSPKSVYDLFYDHIELIVNSKKEFFQLILNQQKNMRIETFDKILYKSIDICVKTNNITVIIKCIKNLRKNDYHAHKLESILPEKYYLYLAKSGFNTTNINIFYNKHKQIISNIVKKLNKISYINIINDKIVQYLLN